ncbi:MAG: prenyltransferase/squalene oxidase repeat-containing protein [Polyangiales bacterium]
MQIAATEAARARGGEPPQSQRVSAAVDAALGHLAATQSTEGCWKGDYGGPLFLLPMYVGVAHAVGLRLDDTTRAGMVRYLRKHQNQDGGFGLHIEGDSHVFTSVLGYVALRLLGESADDEALQRARSWFSERGGPLAAASWCKFFLALLNLYDYEGLDPVPPELWLLPESLPVHPSRLWCHCRMVYLPMSYLYGRRARIAESPLVAALRAELYAEPYDAIDWVAARGRVAATDSYTPRSGVLTTVNRVLFAYEKRASRRLRARALDFVLAQIGAEDRNTDFICIGPVNKLFHTLVWFFEGKSEPLTRHLSRLPDYLYHAPDGIKMQGYNSSELWDTAFAAQAICATGAVESAAARAIGNMLELAHGYVDRSQVREDVEDRAGCYRDPSKGGWPFSNRPHGWPITDCTAEGLKASLQLAPRVKQPIEEQRLADAVDLMLGMQNDDGGWASYERTRGPRWLERLNPSDCFGEIMIDYSYVECTSACMQALAAFRARYPGRKDSAIERALDAARDFLLAAQREDGSWEGSWGICFTYGTWFGVLGLRAAGLDTDQPALQRAADFLIGKQLPDGGWGELAESCRARRYVHAESGQAVMTSWALLALMAAGRRQSSAVERGVRFLLDRQRGDGSFPPEHIAGMFNRTCAIHYDNYLKIFPLWALAEARNGAAGRASSAAAA